MSGVCSFHVREPIDRLHHFWKHGVHTLPWRSLIDKLDTREPRANQCKSLVCNNTRQARQSSFFKVMACQVTSVQQQILPGDLLAERWHSPMAWGWGLSIQSTPRTGLCCSRQEPEPWRCYSSSLSTRHHSSLPLVWLCWQWPSWSQTSRVHVLSLPLNTCSPLTPTLHPKIKVIWEWKTVLCPVSVQTNHGLRALTCRYVLGNFVLIAVGPLRADVCIRHVSGQIERSFERSSHQIVHPNFWLQSFTSNASLRRALGEWEYSRERPATIDLSARAKGGQEHGMTLLLPQRSLYSLCVCFPSSAGFQSCWQLSRVSSSMGYFIRHITYHVCFIEHLQITHGGQGLPIWHSQR